MPSFGTPKRNAIGSLRQRVTIQRQDAEDEPDERGQPVYVWSDVARKVPCEIRSLRGSEVEIAQQLVAEASHMVKMRASQRVDTTMKIVFRGRDLFIGHIDDVENVGRFMYLVCAEKK
jgi:SPP1 family predicted phage head-tail adaptor